MRGDNFWKGVIVLCLTLLTGVFVTDFFKLEKAKPKFARINKELNCQPADADLKYHKLESAEASSRQEPKTITGGGMLSNLEKFERLESDTKELLYRPKKDKFDPATLLHKENCYELNGRK